MAKHRLRRVLTLHSLLATALPFGVMLLLLVIWISPQIRSDLEQRQLQLARVVGLQVESFLHEGAAMVKLAATISRNAPVNQNHQRNLDALLESSGTIRSLYLITADGSVSDVALKKSEEEHRRDLLGLNLSANPLFIELSTDGSPRWSRTFLSVIHGGLVAAYGLQWGGTTIVGEIDLGLLTTFLQQVSTEEGLLILVVDRNGQIVADNHGQYTAQQLNISNLPMVRAGIASAAPVTDSFTFAGIAMLGTITPISGANWHILVAKSSRSAYRTAWDIGKIVLGSILFALTVGLLLAAKLSRKLASRFEDLTSHAQTIAKGDDPGDWPTSSIREFDQLSSNLQHMAQRLQDSEFLYRTLFDQLPDGVVLWDAFTLKPVQFNAAACAHLGYTRDEFAGLTVADFHVSRSAGEIDLLQKNLQKKGTISFEAVHRTKAGESRSMVISSRQIELSKKPMFLAIHRDITATKMAAAEIKNTLDLLDMFMKYSPIYTFIKEVSPTQSRMLQVSENYQQMVGIPTAEMLGKTMEELFPADLAAKMTADDWQVVSGGKVLEVEEVFKGRSYTSIKFPIQQESRTLLAGYLIDITERKRAEEQRLSLEKQLLHAQKLESLGILAGGIAHDFNNILLAIMGNTEMAMRRISKAASPDEHLQRIRQAAEKAAALARQMLAYSGKGNFQIETLDLNQLIEESLSMLEVSISKKASLQLNLRRPLPAVDADATQLRQIIMNLVINASEAIGDQSGVISVATDCISCDQSDLKSAWLDEELRTGQYLCLEVADTGCGMDSQTLAKLFDPFFTTKFTGRGLGMAAVLGIVRGHKGVIKVDSTPDSGSVFRVLLPTSEKSVEVAADKAYPDDWRGAGKILLVDDEQEIRNIAAEMLKDLGFSVVTANDGDEALALYRACTDIDLVILDLTMPRMGGEQCFHELKKINPHVRVIMSSGYSELVTADKITAQGQVGFLQKPYRLATLSEALQKVLKEAL